MISQLIKNKIKTFLPRPVIEILSTLRHIVFAEKIQDKNYYINSLQGKDGIEIGGPSPIFKYTLPIYKVVNSLDGVNFSSNTIWEGNIKEGLNFNYYKKKNGFQFISDGTDLSAVRDSCYDFVLSSNCLEHIANPLKALNEWGRVLKDEGFLILVLPNKKSNFDHKRPTTSFKHILEDYNNNVTENDLTHLTEILSLHDLSMDLPAENIENLKIRSLDNFNNRCLHHHVFDLDVMTQMIEFAGFKLLKKFEGKTDFYLLASKSSQLLN